jgi:hypothetical protein
LDINVFDVRFYLGVYRLFSLDTGEREKQTRIVGRDFSVFNFAEIRVFQEIKCFLE